MFVGRAAVRHLPMLWRPDDHARRSLGTTPFAASNLEQFLMNSQLFTNKNSIWHLDDMRAGSERFVEKAGDTPFSRRNQPRRTNQTLSSNTRRAATGIKQPNQAKMAATQLTQISCQAPREMPLSP